MDKAQAHLEERRSNYMKIGIGLIIAILGFNFLSQKNSQNNSTADAYLGQALVALAQDDTENAKFQLETVLNDYGGTKSAELAGYYLG